MVSESARSDDPGNTVALVMMDTRTPERLVELASAPKISLKYNVSTILLTHYLNLRYACTHGYSLLFYRLTSEGCEHPRWGARHPSYCKLAAVAAALDRGYRFVVYIDSDAFVRNTSLGLPALLRAYGGNASVERHVAWFGWDTPYSLGPNAGFSVLRGGGRGGGGGSGRGGRGGGPPAAHELLQAWWNVYAGRYSLDHAFEQHTLHWQLLHLHRFRRRLSTLSLRTMEPETPDAVVHLDHNAGTKTRIWTMARAAAELLAHEADAHGEHGATALGLRKWLPVLRGSRQRLSYSQRQQAVEAVVRAAGRDAKALLDAARGAAEGRGACVHRLSAFNATSAAATHLRLPPRASYGVLGLPLQLSNCSRPAPSQQPSPPSSSSSHADAFGAWQAWTIHTIAPPRTEGIGVASNGSATASGGDDATGSGSGGSGSGARAYQRFSLLARPRACLSLGETRAPRTPYSVLAQLAKCEQPPGSAAAVRAHLRHDGATAMLQTSHRLRALRARLPEHRLDCGFWPNCTRTSTVLPKACWSDLAADAAACGKGEATLATLVARLGTDAPASRRGIVVAPGGPMPRAALQATQSERLCLSAWRGKLVEGAPVVFVPCPKPRRNAERAERAAVRPRDQLVEWSVEADPSTPHSGAVRLVPRLAPTLCLTAPPLLPTT